MKQLTSKKWAVWLILAFGLAGLLLRLAMYANCVDGRGLLITGNLYHLSTWAVTAMTALVLILVLWPLEGSRVYEHNFWPSIPAAAGTLLAAAGIGATVLNPAGYPADTLTLLWRGSGFLAAAGLAAAGICRGMGKKPFFLLYALASVFFALHIANQYRIWSGNPQAPDYSFQLLACICLMLFAYYQTAFTVGSGKRRAQLFSALMGVYLCFLAAAQTETLWLYAGGGLWLLTDRCTMSPPRRRHTDLEDAEDDEDEEPSEEVA